MQILRYILFAALVCWGCSKEKTTYKVPLEKEVSTEKFNPKIISGIKRDKNSGGFIIRRGDTIIKIMNYDTSYLKETYLENSAFINTKTYYKETLGIEYQCKHFHNLPFGLRKRYDKQGNLIEVVDLDKNFSLTIDSLIAKVKTIANVDISKNIPGVILDRETKYRNYNYYVHFPVSNGNKIRILILDGQTGEVKEDILSAIKES